MAARGMPGESDDAGRQAPVRYDALLARDLAAGIAHRWEGVPVRRLLVNRGLRAASIEFGRGARDASRETQDETREGCLTALLHPSLGHLFVSDPPGISTDVPPATFRRLFLGSAVAAPDERVVLLTFVDADGRQREGAVLQLRTTRFNLFHLRFAGGWRVESVLVRGHGVERGDIWAPPAAERAAADLPPSIDDWRAWVGARASSGHGHGVNWHQEVLRSWAWTSPANVDAIAEALSGQSRSGQSRSDRFADAALAAYLSIHPATGERVGADVLGAVTRQVEVAGGAAGLLSHLPAGADGLTWRRSGGVAGRGSGGSTSEEREHDQLLRRISARRKRAAKRLAALERELASVLPPEETRADGNLLLARKAEIPRGSRSVTLVDFDGAKRKISLDPGMDAVTNAQELFKEAARRERALERLPAAISAARARLAELNDLSLQVEENGPSDSLWSAIGGRPLSGPGASRGRGGKRSSGRPREGPVLQRAPFVRYVSSGGFEILVGRGASDNDDLTFRHARREDIWLHASQASGAHVILRWGRADENPPGRDLAEAATAAAVHSRARHSGTVPVIWTRRKYVRKPRKSLPGSVVAERERTLFVSPDSDLLAALKPTDT